jgi:hypothetical protein
MDEAQLSDEATKDYVRTVRRCNARRSEQRVLSLAD